MAIGYVRNQRRGWVYGKGTPDRRPLVDRCLEKVTSPHAVLAYANAASQAIGIVFTLVLASSGADVTLLLVAKQIESYIVHAPMYALTLHLSKKGY